MFCPSCGREIADDSVFCSLCGAPIKPTGTTQSPVAASAAANIAAKVPSAEDNTFERVVAEYGDVATEEDLAIFLNGKIKLLDTSNYLPLLSFTALIFVLGGTYNSYTFWVLYPALGYFFDFVAVVLFLASFYITYVKGRVRSLPDFFGSRYRQTLFAQFMTAKAALRSNGDSRTTESGGAQIGGKNEFAQYIVDFPGTVSAADLAVVLRAKLDWIVATVRWIFFGLWLLTLFYLMVWFWFGTGPLEYASGIIATLLFIAMLGNSIVGFDGGLINNLRKLRTPSQLQVVVLENYLQAKRLLRK